MNDAEIVGAILRDEDVRPPAIVDGRLTITARLVDRRELVEELSACGAACGWVTTTGAVARIRPGEAGRFAAGERILSADLYRAADDSTVIIRAEGDRWRVRRACPGPGPGLLVTRRWIALDGGYLRYQTAWSPDETGALAAGLTRFVGFDDGGDRG